MDSVRRKMEILRNNQKEIPEIKSIVTEIMIQQTDIVKERTCELEDITI